MGQAVLVERVLHPPTRPGGGPPELGADPVAAGVYGLLTRALAEVAPNDLDMYYAVKDPACDLIIADAELGHTDGLDARTKRRVASV